MERKKKPIGVVNTRHGIPRGGPARAPEYGVFEDGDYENHVFEDGALVVEAFDERPRPVVERDLHRRWERLRVVLSLAVFPGCPQLYVGQTGRGFAWSLVFLLVVLPLSFFLFFTWGFSERAFFWILGGLGAFFLLGALGPAFRAWRGGPLRAARRPLRVATYAGVIAAVFAAESGWFLFHHFEAVTVSSGALAPLVGQGEEAAILLSRYTRPVHGEIILFERPSVGAYEGGRRHLGRVIAKPGDAVSLEKGDLVVNGILIDFGGTDQRRSLEKAGRRLRRKRFVTGLFSRKPDLSAIRDRTVRLHGEDWGLILPAGSYLVLPDVRSPFDSPGSAPPDAVEVRGSRSESFAWLVNRGDVVGRMVAPFW